MTLSWTLSVNYQVSRRIVAPQRCMCIPIVVFFRTDSTWQDILMTYGRMTFSNFARFIQILARRFQTKICWIELLCKKLEKYFDQTWAWLSSRIGRRIVLGWCPRSWKGANAQGMETSEYCESWSQLEYQADLPCFYAQVCCTKIPTCSRSPTC